VRLAIECHEWPVDVPLDWTSSLYLTLREALTNVEKHAHASEVTVLLRGDEEQLRIIVSDDGVGFAQHQASYVRPPHLTTGLGLDGMRDRVTKLNGQLAIMTSPGGGTQLEIHIPYTQPHEAAMVAKPESQRLEAGHYH
jgi:signal transduction histidine kinase